MNRFRILFPILGLAASCALATQCRAVKPDSNIEMAKNQLVDEDRGPCIVAIDWMEFRLTMPKSFWGNRGRYRGQIPTEQKAPDQYHRNYGNSWLSEMEVAVRWRDYGDKSWSEPSRLEHGFFRPTVRYAKFEGDPRFTVELHPEDTPFRIVASFDGYHRPPAPNKPTVVEARCPNWDDKPEKR